MLSTLVLSGCVSAQSNLELPAVLSQPSLEVRQQLQQAVGKLLNSQPIKLADNVFTQQHTIIVAPRQQHDPSGRLLNGRELRSGDSFSLFSQNSQCYLRHIKTEKALALNGIQCVAISHQPKPAISQ